MTAPPWWATAAVNAATWLLPPGPARDRYRCELSAEQWSMTSRELVGHALSVLRNGPALRRAAIESGIQRYPHSVWWCRLRLYHRWAWRRNADNRLFRQCRTCGLDDDDLANMSYPIGG